jgi:hypothetical protein
LLNLRQGLLRTAKDGAIGTSHTHCIIRALQNLTNMTELGRDVRYCGVRLASNLGTEKFHCLHRLTNCIEKISFRLRLKRFL